MRQLQPVYSSDSNCKLFLSISKARDARIVWWILKKEVIDCIEVGMRHGRESSKLVSLWFLTTYARAINEQFQTLMSCFEQFARFQNITRESKPLIKFLLLVMQSTVSSISQFGMRILEILLEEHAAVFYVFTYKPLLLYSINSIWDHMVNVFLS